MSSKSLKNDSHTNPYIYKQSLALNNLLGLIFTQSAGAVEYTDCTSAEE